MFAFWFVTYLACESVKPKVQHPELTLNGYWWSGLDSFGSEDFKIGLQWQLAGIGLEPNDWNLRMFHEADAQLYWVELSVNDMDNNCISQLFDQINPDWPFAVQLSLLTQHPEHVALFTKPYLTLSEWEDQFSINQETLLTESLIASGNRSVSFNDGAALIGDIAYRAYSMDHPEMVETIDVMPNGRLRYGLYQNGDWNSTNGLGSVAGCQWCHEGKLLDIQAQPNVDGYTPYEVFSTSVLAHNALISTWHDTRYPNGQLLNLSHHAAGEIIVEHYLYPNLDSLIIELGLDEGGVQAWLDYNGIESHFHSEYPSWGAVYRRSDINRVLGEIDVIPMTVRSWDLSVWSSLIGLEDCNNEDG